MKKILILLYCVSLLACTKKDNIAVPLSGFSFTANNIYYSWNFPFDKPSANGFALISRSPDSGGIPGGFMVQGNNSFQNVTLNCFIETDILTTGSYKTITTSSTGYIQSSFITNGITYSPVNISDSVVVRISSISGNLASGTFNAVMHVSGPGPGKVEISNGEFTNLLIAN